MRRRVVLAGAGAMVEALIANRAWYQPGFAAPEWDVSPATSSPAGPAQGILWVQPPNYGGAGRLAPDFFEMFTTRIEDWAEARQSTGVWVLRMTSIKGRDAPISEAFLSEAVLPRLHDWGIRLAVNVTGATLAGCNDFEHRVAVEGEAIERLIDGGGRVSFLSLQSPLSKVGGRECPTYGRAAGFDRRIKDVVRYGTLMTGRFPGIQLGLVDAMPAKGWAYAEVYRTLVGALRDEGLELAFLHLDFPAESASADWGNVLAVEDFVRGELGIPFGLLYVSKIGGATSNVAFRDAVLAAYRAYRAAGGRPDHLKLTSWYSYPDANLPEDDEVGAPFMNLVRDFARLGGVAAPAPQPASAPVGGSGRDSWIGSRWRKSS